MIASSLLPHMVTTTYYPTTLDPNFAASPSSFHLDINAQELFYNPDIR
jgi:hypothetical protein